MLGLLVPAQDRTFSRSAVTLPTKTSVLFGVPDPLTENFPVVVGFLMMPPEDVVSVVVVVVEPLLVPPSPVR